MSPTGKRSSDAIEPDRAGGGAPVPSEVLVTGGAGFIGSHLTEALLARGSRVTVVDNLTTGRRPNLPAAHPALEIIESDLRRALTGPLAGRRFDEIYHLAAAVGVDLVMKDPVLAIEINVEQTAALLRFAAGLDPDGRDNPADAPGPGTPTFIASSSEVYGKPTREVFCEDDDVVYGPTVVTRWSYAQTKAIDEYLALAYHGAGACPVVVARFFNTVGPRQVGDYGMVLPRFVRAAIEGEPVRVFGDGAQSRCFCDVRDVVAAVPVLLGNTACHGRVFNLGSDQPISIAELAGLVIDTVGSGSTIEFVPYTEAYPPGFEDLKRRRPDLSRVREAIAFEPRTDLATTIGDLAESIRAEIAKGVAP